MKYAHFLKLSIVQSWTESETMKRAAAYIRVSTEEQIEFSPDSQIRAIKKYAEQNEITISENLWFLDEGISGRTADKRPAFKRMIALAKSKPKPFDVILVWKFSRFARNREDSVVYKSMLRKQYNIDVISISESIGNDKTSVLFEAIIEAMDEYYSINLAEEVKRGMSEKAKKGGILSIAPFGYEVSDGNYVLIENEAEIIKKVFTDFINGDSFKTISKKLNLMRVKTHRNKCIEPRTIEYWLNNPVYAGKIRWNPNGKTGRNYDNCDLIVSQGSHEPVIDDKTWEKAQQKLKKAAREEYIYGKKFSHWLIGILKCGECGARMANCNGYFVCGKKLKGKCEGNGSISVMDAEREVLNVFSENAKIALKHTECKNLKSVGEAVELERRILKSKFERCRYAYENGVYTLSEYKSSCEKLRCALDEIQKEKDDFAKTKELCENNKFFFDLLSSRNISNNTKNFMLKKVISEIIKGGDRGEELKFIFKDF